MELKWSLLSLMHKIALVGNPNCGKTTVFNLLTGANQKVGNWPGVTVEKKFGFFELNGEKSELVDLPGIYSLEQDYRGVDENIALDYLSEGNIDLIINIIDATNLERHMKNTNLVITGEGRVDSQTAYGKTPSGVAKSARKHGIPTLVIGGGITDDAKDIFSHGIDALESACARDMSLEDAIKHSREHLANAAERAIRLVLVGKKITKK